MAFLRHDEAPGLPAWSKTSYINWLYRREYTRDKLVIGVGVFDLKEQRRPKQL
jgi:hypothetical protein